MKKGQLIKIKGDTYVDPHFQYNERYGILIRECERNLSWIVLVGKEKMYVLQSSLLEV